MPVGLSPNSNRPIEGYLVLFEKKQQVREAARQPAKRSDDERGWRATSARVCFVANGAERRELIEVQWESSSCVDDKLARYAANPPS